MSISGRAYTNLATIILGKLEEHIGENPQEDILSILLRLLGMINKEETKPTFISSFVKKKDYASENAKKDFVQYVTGLKNRLEKWKKDSNVARINKIKRLIGNEEVPEVGITTEDTLDIVAQKILKFQDDLAKNKDENGLLTTQSALYNTASDKVDALVASLPIDEFGDFGSELIALLKADNVFVSTVSQRISRRLSALKIELNKLEKEEEYLIKGISIEAGIMSLRIVVEVILFLLQEIEYKCKECFYFESSTCLYGANNLETVPEKSCVEIYNRKDNEFWRPSDNTVDKTKDFAKAL